MTRTARITTRDLELAGEMLALEYAAHVAENRRHCGAVRTFRAWLADCDYSEFSRIERALVSALCQNRGDDFVWPLATTDAQRLARLPGVESAAVAALSDAIRYSTDAGRLTWEWAAKNTIA